MFKYFMTILKSKKVDISTKLIVKCNYTVYTYFNQKKKRLKKLVLKQYLLPVRILA